MDAEQGKASAGRKSFPSSQYFFVLKPPVVHVVLNSSAAFADACAVLPQPLAVGKAYRGIAARAIQRVGLGQFIESCEFASHVLHSPW